MSESHKTEPVTVTLPTELRARLDAAAVRFAVVKGRPVSRSATTRALLERALSEPPAAVELNGDAA